MSCDPCRVFNSWRGLLVFQRLYPITKVWYSGRNLITVNLDKTGKAVHKGELEDITKKNQVLMGEGCRVAYKFLEDISPSPSGKYRYTMSEVV